MFGKKKKETSPVEPVNPEILQAEKAFKRETMVLEARPLLRRILFVSWFAIDGVLLLIFVGYVGYYMISGSFSDKARVATIGEDITSMHAISEARAAQSYAVTPVQTFALGGENYDLLSAIENPNEDWFGTFTYRFVSAAGESKSFTGAVMPLETRHLLALHQTFSGRPTDAQLVIDEFIWERVDAGAVPDVAQFLVDHNGFVIENADYHFDIELDGQQIPRSSFTIMNGTSYSYWTPEFIVLLRRAGAIAGVNAVTIPGFEAGETREIDLNWFGAAPSSGEVEVIPNINFFDAEAYMPPAGAPGSDLRDDVGDRRR